jgi:geranylgeranylglycerol-phosphate geranylgeranyltransferase
MKPSTASALIALARWENALLAATGVYVGAWWAGWAHAARVALAAASAIAFTAGANAANDVCDVEIDRVAHPERPIPAGRVSAVAAHWFAGAALTAGIILAGLAAPPLALVSAPVAALILLYSPRLKRLGLPGNLTVAVLASLPFLYGAWAVGRPRAGLALVAVAAPLHFAREVAKDLDDAAGDRGLRRTVPLRWGATAARTLIVVALLAFAVQILPIARVWPRLAVGILPALACAGFGAARVVQGARGAPRALKAAMVCAMAALVAARAPWR